MRTDERLKYLRLLSAQYPTLASLYTEIINLRAISNLPKGTEHFISDLHGEFESVEQILNNCSGVIREKLRLLYGDRLTHAERSELCTLIYYPEDKLKRLHAQRELDTAWYRTTLTQLIELAKLLSSKYSRRKVRSDMPEDFAFVLDELIHAQPDEDNNQHLYHERIFETILYLKSGDAFICALATLIKRLAVEWLHVVGDVFDRGPRPDSIMELLIERRNVDIEWGNHDILWMGAASGCESCIAAVVRNSIAYRNMQVLESGYAISLRPLTVFAETVYPHLDPMEAAARAITVIMFKLEGQLIHRHPEWEMGERLMLHRIDRQRQEILIGGKTYSLAGYTFPTVDPADPYALTPGEQEVIDQLRESFHDSRRLHRHIRFVYEKGAMYKRFNGNLLFHGCIPMDEDGSFHTLVLDGQPVKGRALMRAADRLARRAYYSRDPQAQDLMWYLWCGEFSPVCGRRTTTFEHIYLTDPEVRREPRNPYYHYSLDAEHCKRILREFDLAETGHIINGHTPVKVSQGESPIKADGRLFVIDGGFCRAISKKTGIAGYTLISNSHGLRLMQHDPFTSLERALEANSDIHTESAMVELYATRQFIADTDEGQELAERIADLEDLL
ncbi:MAG: fructose-1,6-bisphosphatase, partial [Clostridia bacterium]|nr:fructose-1,6-bisphosphatase [Clostridia bacterium]